MPTKTNLREIFETGSQNCIHTFDFEEDDEMVESFEVRHDQYEIPENTELDIPTTKICWIGTETQKESIEFIEDLRHKFVKNRSLA